MIKSTEYVRKGYKMSIRNRLYEIIEIAEEDDKLSKIYDLFMMLVIITSMLPLTVKDTPPSALWIDRVATVIFIIDYFLRLLTADIKLSRGKASFVLYPFTPMAIIDLLSILPSVTALNNGFRILKIFRLFRTFRVLRILKVVRYSKSITMIINVFKKQKEALCVVGGLAAGYILISALIVFNVEPDTFPTFFDAIYWATVSLTTVGYGDIYATSQMGKIITMISAILGIAIVALPAGIVTAGYMDELNNSMQNKL